MTDYPTNHTPTPATPPLTRSLPDPLPLHAAGLQFHRLPPYKYILTNTVSVQSGIKGYAATPPEPITLMPSGFLSLSPGYKWDGPSGPVPDFAVFQRASAFHDALCRLMDAAYLPQRFQRATDRLYLRLIREDGCPRLLSYLKYYVLRRYDAYNVARKARRRRDMRAQGDLADYFRDRFDNERA